MWESGARDRLEMRIDSYVNLLLTYESGRWRDAEDARRRRKARDL